MIPATPPNEICLARIEWKTSAIKTTSVSLTSHISTDTNMVRTAPTVLLFPERSDLGRGNISGIVPSCLPSIKPGQTGKGSEQKRGLIASPVHFKLWLLTPTCLSQRLIVPPGGRDSHYLRLRGYSPIRLDAVFMNHGFQGVRVCWKNAERKSQRYIQNRGSDKPSVETLCWLQKQGAYWKMASRD